MATLESTRFGSFVLPSQSLFSDSDPVRPTEIRQSILSLSSSSSQQTYGPLDTFSRSGCEAKADGSFVASDEVCERALDGDIDSDDGLLSFEELFQYTNISTRAFETKRNLLLQPATSPGSGLNNCRGDIPAQVIILDDDEPHEAGAGHDSEVAPGDLNTRHVEEDCWIDEPAPKLVSGEQQGVRSAPARDQPQILLQSSTPLQDPIDQQDIGGFTQTTSIASTPQSLPKPPSDNGDNGWTDECLAEMEKELDVAIVEQVDASSTTLPESPPVHSVETPHLESQSQECNETSVSTTEEMRNTSREHTSAPGHEKRMDREERNTRVFETPEESVERRGEEPVQELEVAMQQQEEVEGQKKELLAISPQQNLVIIHDPDDPKDREAAEALPATYLEIDKHHFRLRGIRTQKRPERQTKTKQYRLVWGVYPNKSGTWVDEDQVKISIQRTPCAQPRQDMALHEGRDTMRVSRIRPSQYGKGSKGFEYLIDAFGPDDRTWISEGQLGVSLSPELLASLGAQTGHFPPEHCHTSLPSRSSSVSADPELEGESTTRKHGYQDAQTEFSDDTYHFASTDNNHCTYDTSDEDPRPAKRRKPRSARAVISTTSQGDTPELHVGQPGPLVALSTATPKIDDTQPQVDHEYLSTFVDNNHQHASRTSRSPSVASEAVPVAAYREWPFQGFLKRTRIGDDVTYNLEFKLPSISGQLHLPIDPKALNANHNAATHSQIHEAPLQVEKRNVKRKSTSAAACHPNFKVHYQVPSVRVQAKRARVLWTGEENEVILEMMGRGCSWEEIDLAFQQRKIQRTLGAIKQQYYTKLK